MSPREMNPDALFDGVVRGFRNANREYEKISGGEWINERGVESYVASHLAKSLRGKNMFVDCPVYLEMSCNEFERDCARGKKPMGRRGRHLNPRNRLDVVLTDESFSPLFIAELKVTTNKLAWSKDVERIASFVKRYRVPYGGFFAFVSDVKRKDDSDIKKQDNIDRWRDELKKIACRQKGVVAHYCNNEPSRWKKYDAQYRWAIAGVIFMHKPH